MHVIEFNDKTQCREKSVEALMLFMNPDPHLFIKIVEKASHEIDALIEGSHSSNPLMHDSLNEVVSESTCSSDAAYTAGGDSLDNEFDDIQNINSKQRDQNYANFSLHLYHDKTKESVTKTFESKHHDDGAKATRKNLINGECSDYNPEEFILPGSEFMTSFMQSRCNSPTKFGTPSSTKIPDDVGDLSKSSLE